ncbi:MAG: AMP-binding protein [Rhodospirillaceae bacterium]|nr:AMP-binding protein [Rhodospirillaceae bacterium]
MANEFHDTLETRDPSEREASLMSALSRHVAHAKANTAWFAKSMADVDATAITSREALATLPVLRKSELLDLQKSAPPLGGVAATDVGKLAHIFMSPGPIYDPDGHRPDAWRFARAMFAAGLRPGNLVLNCFSYHLTPAGMMSETGAHAIGCPVIPGGVGNTEMQVRAIADLKPSFYVGTPSFLKIILEKARELGEDASSLKQGLVGGEALPPSLRAEIAELGCQVLQCYGTADLGLVAYEAPPMQGMILDEQVIVEIVRPGTGEPVPDGEVGEVVVTVFNPDYPLIRFGTGDMSAIMDGPSPCGRTNQRIKGWMGRADQTTKVKGMFVHPSMIAEVVKRHPEIGKARLVISGRTGNDQMVISVEAANVSDKPGDELGDAIKATLSTVTKLRGEVTFVEPGDLPNDGVVIEDARSYD